MRVGGPGADNSADAAESGEVQSDEQLVAEHRDVKNVGSAHKATGGVVGVATKGKGNAPVACVYATGYGSAESTLAVDSSGAVVVAPMFFDDTLRYSVSRDGAETWSAPRSINAPAARHVVFGAIVTREPGTIAVAYYGSGDGVAYDGFVAESKDALAEVPSFWSAAITHDGPLFSDGFDIGYTAILQGGDLVEIAQVRYAPNGDIWAAFTQDMCPGLGTSAGCDWDLAEHVNSPYQGVVGRLVHR